MAYKRNKFSRLTKGLINRTFVHERSRGLTNSGSVQNHRVYVSAISACRHAWAAACRGEWLTLLTRVRYPYSVVYCPPPSSFARTTLFHAITFVYRMHAWHSSLYNWLLSSRRHLQISIKFFFNRWLQDNRLEILTNFLLIFFKLVDWYFNMK